MRTVAFVKACTLFLGLVLGISACTILGGSPEEATPTPVPTSSIPGLQVTPPGACLVGEQAMIRVEEPQGDLIAWSPVADNVAYIAPSKSSTWNVGELNLLSAPSFDKPVNLASQAAGELSWSPAGRIIAFLSLRKGDNLYTIDLLNPADKSTRDLFPEESARTDNYSSKKAILNWVNEGRLRVLTSCGLDCMQRLDFGVLTGLSTPFGDPIQPPWDMWAADINQPAPIPQAYADLKGELNWSPDGKSIAYVDENGSAWIINVDEGTLYPLDIGTYGTATETDWSFDSQYLAVKVDEFLKIYGFNCR